MNPSVQLAFEEILRRLDEIDAQMERRFAKTFGVKEQPASDLGVGSPGLCPVAQIEGRVVADNWGGEFEQEDSTSPPASLFIAKHGKPSFLASQQPQDDKVGSLESICDAADSYPPRVIHEPIRIEAFVEGSSVADVPSIDLADPSGLLLHADADSPSALAFPKPRSGSSYIVTKLQTFLNDAHASHISFSSVIGEWVHKFDDYPLHDNTGPIPVSLGFLPDLRGNDFANKFEAAIADRFRIPIGEIDRANNPIDPGPKFASQDSEAEMRELVLLPHVLPSGEDEIPNLLVGEPYDVTAKLGFEAVLLVEAIRGDIASVDALARLIRSGSVEYNIRNLSLGGYFGLISAHARLLAAAGNWDSCQAAGVHIRIMTEVELKGDGKMQVCTAACNHAVAVPATCSADCPATGCCFLDITYYDEASAASAASIPVSTGVILGNGEELGRHHHHSIDLDAVPADTLARIVKFTLAHYGEAHSPLQLRVPITMHARAASVLNNIVGFEQYLDELGHGEADLGVKLLQPVRYYTTSSPLMICSVWWGALPVAQSVTWDLSWELLMLDMGFFVTSKEVQCSAHCFSSQCYKCRAYICFVCAVPNPMSLSQLFEIHGDGDNLRSFFNSCMAPVCLNILSPVMITSSMHLELRKRWLVAGHITCFHYSSDYTVASSLFLLCITTANSEMTVTTSSHQLAHVAESSSSWLEKSLYGKGLTDCIRWLWEASGDANFSGEDGPLPIDIIAVWRMDGIIQNEKTVYSDPPLQGSDLDADGNAVFSPSSQLLAIQMIWDPGDCCTLVDPNSGQGQGALLEWSANLHGNDWNWHGTHVHLAMPTPPQDHGMITTAA